MPRLIWLATRALMEILGLDPYQSETQYLEGKIRVSAKRHQSGNTVETYFRFTGRQVQWR